MYLFVVFVTINGYMSMRRVSVIGYGIPSLLLYMATCKRTTVLRLFFTPISKTVCVS